MEVRKEIVDFHGEMVLLENYSALNYTGLVKILKKYDKRTGALIRLPFIQKVLQQPFFTTDLLYKLVKECESMLDSVFPKNEQPLVSVEDGEGEGGGEEKPSKPGSSLVRGGIPELEEIEYMESLYMKSTVAALRALKEIRSGSSTVSVFSLPPLQSSGKEERQKADFWCLFRQLGVLQAPYSSHRSFSLWIPGQQPLSNSISIVDVYSFEIFIVQAQGGLKTGFYSSTCPKAEDIMRSTVEKYFSGDSTIAPGLLRLHFHDCFVQGCDGSVLISGASAERSALQNLGLRGFEVVDDAKTQLGATCLGIVSCADIPALAARDAVDLTGGPPLGRRDGRVSSALEATSLRSPADSVAVQRQNQTRGFGGMPDTVSKYAGTIRGLLGLRFEYEFPKAMIKMSSIGVKTGAQGEIRKICSKFN
ncbi:hypothetical protein COCNU_03G016860 [Cocos nucifera]|uniref:Peroxidase n=1 Tax=Cocos nucifera TaxID=13894 RepID=A0A8K0I489_COCNU|nr:hypothetical protein COCNU_03G016860 [Cocos nucifera]